MDMETQYITTQDEMQRLDEGPLRIRVMVQPEDVQVKRVGRASCIEPEIKLCLESDAPYPIAVTINAYLKVLGKDDKHKFILLRKSDEILLSKAHKREIVPMRLRFLKNIKVQVLKRNLGVARPEASVVFEAVTHHNEIQASTSTTYFAIISDPRYLDEVKKRRACERIDDEDHADHLPDIHGDYPTTPESDEAYVPPRNVQKDPKRRRTIKSEDDSSSCTTPPQVPEITTVWRPSDSFSPFQALKDTADEELLANNRDEEEHRLIELVESLKHKGCNFRILPPETHA